MKSTRLSLKLAAAFALGLFFMGCGTTDGGGSSGGVYYGAAYYDPWYYDSYHWHDDGDYIVTPPPNSGVRPEHPIARPPSVAPRPTPMPSIPAMPRPMPRPAMRR
jgi:hypothetical protein